LEAQVQALSRIRWRAAAAIAALLALALVAPRPAAAERAPVAGDASWVWYVSASGGSAKAIARKAERRGLDAVFVKSGDGASSWSQFTPGLVDALHARGLEVCGWQFVYGRDPAAEARVGAGAAEDGADCLIIDAESDYEGRYAAADTYVRKLRRLVGDDFAVGLASFPYVDYHPAFPYSVFLGPGGAQFNLPQVYWHAIGDTPVESLTHTYEWNRPYAAPIYPVGQTYGDPPRRDLKSFRRYSRGFGASGVSWWSWQETSRREWKAITGKAGRPPRSFDPPDGYPELTRGSAGDVVVRAQELLRGAGADLAVSGRFNKRTRRAVEDLQETAGLPVTGEIDDRTWRELLANEPARVRWAAPRTASGARVGAERAPASAALPTVGFEVPPALSGAG
jgi:hypothetical protein